MNACTLSPRQPAVTGPRASSAPRASQAAPRLTMFGNGARFQGGPPRPSTKRELVKVARPSPEPWQEAPPPPHPCAVLGPPHSGGLAASVVPSLCREGSFSSSPPEYLLSGLPVVSKEPLQKFPWLHRLAATSKVPVPVLSTK